MAFAACANPALPVLTTAVPALRGASAETACARAARRVPLAPPTAAHRAVTTPAAATRLPLRAGLTAREIAVTAPATRKRERMALRAPATVAASAGTALAAATRASPRARPIAVALAETASALLARTATRARQTASPRAAMACAIPASLLQLVLRIVAVGGQLAAGMVSAPAVNRALLAKLTVALALPLAATVPVLLASRASLVLTTAR